MHKNSLMHGWVMCQRSVAYSDTLYGRVFPHKNFINLFRQTVRTNISTYFIFSAFVIIGHSETKTYTKIVVCFLFPLSEVHA